MDRAGGSGKPSLPVSDPLASAPGLELAPNGRAMIYLSSAREILPLPTGYPKTLYIQGLPPDKSIRKVAHIYSYVIY